MLSIKPQNRKEDTPMRGKFLLKTLPMAFLSTSAIAGTNNVDMNGILSATKSPYEQAKAKSLSSLAVGPGNIVGKDNNDSNNSVAVGINSKIYNSPTSTIVGNFSKITSSKKSTIIGFGDIENSDFGVAIGDSSSVNNAEYGVAIGSSAKVKNKNSVSLGRNSTTDRDNSISVGTNNLKRQITFVADGLKDSDAATVNQVNKSAEAALKSANSYTDSSSKETLSSANIYTDNKVNKSAEATLKSANSYTDRSSKETLSSANIYTDSKISSYGNKLYQDLHQYTDEKADQLNNRINQVNKRIDKVNKRIDKGLASSAALTGLFQPYGVGKVNFTAGIGGYRSTQALAIGSGYRVNENTAIKAGMALSDSKNIMYNASFNLEW